MRQSLDQQKNQAGPSYVGVIPLSSGNHCLVDIGDMYKLASYNWYEKKERRRKTNYVIAWFPKLQAKTLMHRFILDAKQGEQVDHKDHDGLNNQRSNIRVCTHAENLRNQKKMRCKKAAPFESKYKGVSWHNIGKKWRARLNNKHLGLFKLEIDAAKAWDAAAKQEYGEFGLFNFP